MLTQISEISSLTTSPSILLPKIMTSSNRSDGVYRLNDEDVAQDVNEFDFENDGEDADEGEEKIDSDAVDPVKLNPGSVS